MYYTSFLIQFPICNIYAMLHIECICISLDNVVLRYCTGPDGLSTKVSNYKAMKIQQYSNVNIFRNKKKNVKNYRRLRI